VDFIADFVGDPLVTFYPETGDDRHIVVLNFTEMTLRRRWDGVGWTGPDQQRR